MTKIRVLRDALVPRDASIEDVRKIYGDAAANEPPLEPGTIIENARISTFDNGAYYSHPRVGQPYFSYEGDYEVIND